MIGCMLTGCGPKKTATTSADLDWTKADFKGEQINLLVWEQYADASFVEPYHAFL